MLRPGGCRAVVAPTVRSGPLALIGRCAPGAGGAHLFTETEIADSVESFGLSGVATRRLGAIHWT
ncbi:hypothetical protein [Nocardia sp. NPDC052316]|uniref:hypothetical protein n=1 Tax=Nocardia sp. NPDC052316 TaxID=3364329 RepID=UPI0037C785E6